MFSFARKFVDRFEGHPKEKDPYYQTYLSQNNNGHGLRVLHVAENSPAQSLGLEPWFDYIVSINNHELPMQFPQNSHAYGASYGVNSDGSVNYGGEAQAMESRQVDLDLMIQELATIASGPHKSVSLDVWSAKGGVSRTVSVELHASTEAAEYERGDTVFLGRGRFQSLGATVQSQHLFTASHVWKILSIHAGSPADRAQLVPYSDYIIGCDSVYPQDEGGKGLLAGGSESLLSKTISGYYAHHNAISQDDSIPILLYVYNHDYDCVRPVTVYLSKSWSPEQNRGILGCDVGYGLLHRLPEVIGKFGGQESLEDVIFENPVDISYGHVQERDASPESVNEPVEGVDREIENSNEPEASEAVTENIALPVENVENTTTGYENSVNGMDEHPAETDSVDEAPAKTDSVVEPPAKTDSVHEASNAENLNEHVHANSSISDEKSSENHEDLNEPVEEFTNLALEATTAHVDGAAQLPVPKTTEVDGADFFSQLGGFSSGATGNDPFDAFLGHDQEEDLNNEPDYPASAQKAGAQEPEVDNEKVGIDHGVCEAGDEIHEGDESKSADSRNSADPGVSVAECNISNEENLETVDNTRQVEGDVAKASNSAAIENLFRDDPDLDEDFLDSPELLSQDPHPEDDNPYQTIFQNTPPKSPRIAAEMTEIPLPETAAQLDPEMTEISLEPEEPEKTETHVVIDSGTEVTEKEETVGSATEIPQAGVERFEPSEPSQEAAILPPPIFSPIKPPMISARPAPPIAPSGMIAPAKIGRKKRHHGPANVSSLTDFMNEELSRSKASDVNYSKADEGEIAPPPMHHK